MEPPVCFTVLEPEMVNLCVEGTIHRRKAAKKRGIQATFEEHKLLRMQKEDPTLKQVFEYFEQGKTPESEKAQWYTENAHIDENGYLMKSESHNNGSWDRIIVPALLQRAVFDQFHSSEEGGGHFSAARTTQKAKRYMWADMGKDIAKWQRECYLCQIRAPKAKKVPMVPFEENAAFERIGMDICGPLHETVHGNKHYLVMVDWFTRYAIGVPMPDTKSNTVIQAVLENLIYIHGCPKEILTDNARNFRSNLFEEVARVLRDPEAKQHALPFRRKCPN